VFASPITDERADNSITFTDGDCHSNKHRRAN